MKDDEFIDMRWRIDTLPVDESCIESFPDLAERLDGLNLDSLRVLKEVTNDQLIRYIIYAYHKNSPFVRKISDVKHRKNQALSKAGYDFKKGITEEIDSILRTENEKVADLTLRFLMGENSMKFAALMMQMDAYYKYNYELAYKEVKSIGQHTKAIHELEDSIENLSNDVFSGDAEFNNFVAGSRLRGLILSPEQNAHKKRKI